MKFTDILNEDQVTELGIMKNLKGAVQGAVAGYQANKLQRKGALHSARIVNNLRSEFQKLVGGGTEPTYQNLIKFLSDNGLRELEAIPNPVKASPAAPEKIEPTMEDVGQKLTALQIDNIIRSAVQKNYSRIVAAQQGKSVDEPAAQTKVEPTLDKPAAPEEPAAPAAEPTPQTPTINAQPVAGNIEAIKKAYSMLDPKEREQLKQQLEIIDDQDRLATGTNEAVRNGIRSKFLGIDL